MDKQGFGRGFFLRRVWRQLDALGRETVPTVVIRIEKMGPSRKVLCRVQLLSKSASRVVLPSLPHDKQRSCHATVENIESLSNAACLPQRSGIRRRRARHTDLVPVTVY